MDLHPEDTHAPERQYGGEGVALCGWKKKEVLSVNYDQTLQVPIPAAGHLGVVEVEVEHGLDHTWSGALV